MPVYEQMPVMFDGHSVSTVGSLMTDDTSRLITAHHNYGYAI
jgi:hypothetical protein